MSEYDEKEWGELQDKEKKLFDKIPEQYHKIVNKIVSINYELEEMCE